MKGRFKFRGKVGQLLNQQTKRLEHVREGAKRLWTEFLSRLRDGGGQGGTFEPTEDSLLKGRDSTGRSTQDHPQYSQPGRFAEIDAHALHAPAWAEQSVQTLASYLVEPVKDELEKVRAIYRWIAQNIAYDAKGLATGKYGDLRPDAVLQRRTAVCEGYAGLFEKLARAAGLKVVKISGYAKGYHYTPGDRFDGPTNHAWNGVMIAGQWHLLDSTWGAGYVTEQGQFVRRLEEHYFLTPPSEFIYDHLPEAPKWQLLRQPLSKADFERLVFVKPGFFRHELKIASHPEGVIRANAYVTVTLLPPPDVLLLVHLEEGKRTLEEPLTFIQKEADRHTIQAVFPRPGDYLLKVFATRTGNSSGYEWALDYKIEARGGLQEPFEFPETLWAFRERGAYLYGPMEGRLQPGTRPRFKLKVPGAEAVAVVVGDKPSPLRKQGELFEGQVLIDQGEVKVRAQFPGGNWYDFLLRYRAE
jgi:hypothetical protein